VARPRGFEPLTFASGGNCSLIDLNHFNALSTSV
jgi:hypothetical protein